MRMDSYYKAIEDFHRKFRMKGTNNEDMSFRLNLMVEELGELSEVVTKGKSRKDFLEENVDIFNLLLGNLVSMGVEMEEFDRAFWEKHRKIMGRKKKKINGKYRISGFGSK